MRYVICLLILSICNFTIANSKVTLGLNTSDDVKFPLAFSPDGEYLAAGYADGIIRLWNLKSGQCFKTFSGHVGGVNALVFSRNGKQIISGSEDNLIKIWDTKSGECVRTLAGHKYGITSLSIDNRGNKLASATGYADGEVKIWNINTGKCLKTIKHSPGAGAKNVVFSPEGKLLAVGGYSHSIKVYSVATGDSILTIETNQRIESISFSPNGKCIASSLFNGEVKIWSIQDTNKGKCILTSVEPSSKLSNIAYSPMSDSLIAFTNGYQVFVWNLNNNTYAEINYTWRSSKFISLAYNPEGNMLATGSSDTIIKVWKTIVRDSNIIELIAPPLINNTKLPVNDNNNPQTPFIPFNIVANSLRYADADGDSILEAGDIGRIEFTVENFTNTDLAKLKPIVTVTGNTKGIDFKNNAVTGFIPKMSKATGNYYLIEIPKGQKIESGYIEVSIRLRGSYTSNVRPNLPPRLIEFTSPEHKIIIKTQTSN